MPLPQDWLWLEDTYCLRLMLGGGIRLLADTEGSLLQVCHRWLTCKWYVEYVDRHQRTIGIRIYQVYVNICVPTNVTYVST